MKYKLSIPWFGLVCNRTGEFYKSATVLASSIPKDVGIISSNDQGCISNRSMRHERNNRFSVQDKTLVPIQEQNWIFKKLNNGNLLFSFIRAKG